MSESSMLGPLVGGWSQSPTGHTEQPDHGVVSMDTESYLLGPACSRFSNTMELNHTFAMIVNTVVLPPVLPVDCLQLKSTLVDPHVR